MSLQNIVASLARLRPHHSMTKMFSCFAQSTIAMLTGLWCMTIATMVAAQQVTVSIASVENDFFGATRVDAVVEVFRPGMATLNVAELRIGEDRFAGFHLRCPHWIASILLVVMGHSSRQSPTRKKVSIESGVCGTTSSSVCPNAGRDAGERVRTFGCRV